MAPPDQLPTILGHLDGEGTEIERLRAASARQLLDIQQAIQFDGGGIDGAVVTRSTATSGSHKANCSAVGSTLE